jgi:hypothetical protein
MKCQIPSGMFSKGAEHVIKKADARVDVEDASAIQVERDLASAPLDTIDVPRSVSPSSLACSVRAELPSEISLHGHKTDRVMTSEHNTEMSVTGKRLTSGGGSMVKLGSEKPPVIIDIGAAFTKCGFAGEEVRDRVVVRDVECADSTQDHPLSITPIIRAVCWSQYVSV